MNWNDRLNQKYVHKALLVAGRTRSCWSATCNTMAATVVPVGGVFCNAGVKTSSGPRSVPLARDCQSVKQVPELFHLIQVPDFEIL